MLGGLVASVPVLGPVLAALCGACAGAGAAALVTFLLVNLALVPMMKVAGQELARAFAHREVMR